MSAHTPNKFHPVEVGTDDTIGDIARNVQRVFNFQGRVTLHVPGVKDLHDDDRVLDHFPTGGVTFHVSGDASTLNKKPASTSQASQRGAYAHHPSNDGVDLLAKDWNPLARHDLSIEQNSVEGKANQDNKITGVSQWASSVAGKIVGNTAKGDAVQTNFIG